MIIDFRFVALAIGACIALYLYNEANKNISPGPDSKNRGYKLDAATISQVSVQAETKSRIDALEDRIDSLFKKLEKPVESVIQ